MKCNRVLDILQRELDAAPVSEFPPDVHQHLEQCENCRAQWTRLRESEAILMQHYQQEDITPPASLHRGIMDALHKAEAADAVPAKQAARIIPVIARWAMPVAALLLAGIFSFQLLRKPAGPTETTTAPPDQELQQMIAQLPLPSINLNDAATQTTKRIVADASGRIAKKRSALASLAPNVSLEWPKPNLTLPSPSLPSISIAEVTATSRAGIMNSAPAKELKGTVQAFYRTAAGAFQALATPAPQQNI